MLSLIFVVDVKIIFCNNLEAHLINVENSQLPGDLLIFTKEMFNIKLTLCEKGPYSKFFWSVFSRIRTEYGEILSISPYLVRMRENTNQKNSEYEHISCSVSF